MPASPPRYRKGDRIAGRYLVHQALQGGMGEVYLCLDLKENYPYALKTFQQRYLTNQRMRELFNHEVGIWVALEKHPNIVRCFKLETLDNQPFMLLQWIFGEESRGTNLREWLRRGSLDLQTTLDLTIDICRGLQHAGEKHPGIVHRDLKPDNVLIQQIKVMDPKSNQVSSKRDEEDIETLRNLLQQHQGTLDKFHELVESLRSSSVSYKTMEQYLEELTVPGWLAKITDWGLAKLVRDAGLELPADEYTPSGRQSMVGASGVVGTPPYMAPEQWRGEECDVRTDIYAVGCMLYEMLTGAMPYRATTMEGIRKKHDTASIPILPDTFPKELNMLLAGCLAKRPDERLATMDALLNVLSQLYQQEVGDGPQKVGGLWFFNQLTTQDYADRGSAYYQLGRYEEALVDYTHVIELLPTDVWAHLTRGLIYQELGRYEEALADFTYAIQLEPTNAIAYLIRGAAYYELERFEEALNDYTYAIEGNPNFAQAYFNRGLAFCSLGQYEEALVAYSYAIELEPTDAKTYSNRGQAYFKLGQYEEALVDFSRAIQLDPALALAYFNRGTTYLDLKLYDNALKDYTRAIELDPVDAKLYNLRGSIYGSLGRYMEALTDCTRAIALDPTLAQAYTNRGATYEKLGRYDVALVEYTRAIALDPTLASAYFGRGHTYDTLGRYAEALTDYTHAIEIDPTNTYAYNNRGNTYEKLGRYAEAMVDYTRAIAIDPTNAYAYYNRGNTYQKLGRTEEALANFTRAIEIDSTDADFYTDRGNTYADLGCADQALIDHIRAIELDPTFARPYTNIGVLLYNQGKHREALAFFEQAAQRGDARGRQYAAQVEQMLGTGADVPPAQQAINALMGAGSLSAVRQAVVQFPFMTDPQFIQMVEQAVSQQVPPERRPTVEQRLAWLRQIAGE